MKISNVVDLIFSTYKDFGITNYRCVLSLRDPENKTKYHDDDEMWNKAENALRDVMNSLGIEYTEEIGEAAFYGPKLDVNVKPAVGNEITLSTCQLDFCLPAKFNLSYVDKDGEKKNTCCCFTELYLVLLTDSWHIYLRKQRVTFQHGLHQYR